MIVEDVVVEFPSDLVSDLILIAPSEHGILTAVADEGGRDPVVSQGVRRLPGLPPQGDDAVQGCYHDRVTGSHDAVPQSLVNLLFLDVLDEGERNPVLLVDEVGVPDHGRGRLAQVDRVLSGVECGVPDHGVVACSSVLVPHDLVVDVAGMHHVAFAQIVGRGDEGLVHGLLVLHDTVAAEAVIFKSEVQLREYVLCRQDVQVVGLFLGVGEKGSEVGQLGVGSLGVVHRKRPGRVGPRLVRIVERHSVLALAVEPVVVLDCRACYTQPCGVHVLAPERVVVQPVVVARVRLADIHLVEFPLVGPVDYSFVEKRVRKREGLQDPRRGLLYAVSPRLKAVLHVKDAVREMLLQFLLDLEIVLFPFNLRESGIPGVELGLLPGRRVKVVKRIDPRPVDGVSRRLQGIDHDPVCQRVQDRDVVLVAERVDVLQRVRREDRVSCGQVPCRVDQGEEIGGVLLPCHVADELVPIAYRVRLQCFFRGDKSIAGIAGQRTVAHADGLERDDAHHNHRKPYSFQSLFRFHIPLRVQSDKVTVFPLFPQIPSREKASCDFFVYL